MVGHPDARQAKRCGLYFVEQGGLVRVMIGAEQPIDVSFGIRRFQRDLADCQCPPGMEVLHLCPPGGLFRNIDSAATGPVSKAIGDIAAQCRANGMIVADDPRHIKANSTEASGQRERCRLADRIGELRQCIFTGLSGRRHGLRFTAGIPCAERTLQTWDRERLSSCAIAPSCSPSVLRRLISR